MKRAASSKGEIPFRTLYVTSDGNGNIKTYRENPTKDGDDPRTVVTRLFCKQPILSFKGVPMVIEDAVNETLYNATHGSLLSLAIRGDVDDLNEKEYEMEDRFTVECPLCDEGHMYIVENEEQDFDKGQSVVDAGQNMFFICQSTGKAFLPCLSCVDLENKKVRLCDMFADGCYAQLVDTYRKEDFWIVLANYDESYGKPQCFIESSAVSSDDDDLEVAAAVTMSATFYPEKGQIFNRAHFYCAHCDEEYVYCDK